MVLKENRKRADRVSIVHGRFEMWARSLRGYPQPEHAMEYRRIVYEETCLRCGIFDRQVAPFRFKKSGRSSPSGLTQLNWVFDAFFLPPAIAEEVLKAGITGVSIGPALDHGTGAELTDRVQLLLPTIIACAETSRLPTVTCRPENEEVVALRARFAEQKSLSEQRNMCHLSPALEEKLRTERERFAALPYCGRLKHHAPTSLALIGNILAENTPDLFQTAEWFGSGGSAFRLTIASERFISLIRQRRWKGFVFHRVNQSGWSERTSKS